MTASKPDIKTIAIEVSKTDRSEAEKVVSVLKGMGFKDTHRLDLNWIEHQNFIYIEDGFICNGSRNGNNFMLNRNPTIISISQFMRDYGKQETEKTVAEKSKVYRHRILEWTAKPLDHFPSYYTVFKNGYYKYTFPAELIEDSGDWEVVPEEKKNRCGTCGGEMVLIRGRYPNNEKRLTCPTCSHERLEQINDISSKDYGEMKSEH